MDHIPPPQIRTRSGTYRPKYLRIVNKPPQIWFQPSLKVLRLANLQTLDRLNDIDSLTERNPFFRSHAPRLVGGDRWLQPKCGGTNFSYHGCDYLRQLLCGSIDVDNIDRRRRRSKPAKDKKTLLLVLRWEDR